MITDSTTLADSDALEPRTARSDTSATPNTRKRKRAPRNREFLGKPAEHRTIISTVPPNEQPQVGDMRVLQVADGMNLEVQRFAKVDGKNGERLDWKFEGYYTQVKSAIARLVDLAIRNASGLKAMLEEMDRLEESIWGKVRA